MMIKQQARLLFIRIKQDMRYFLLKLVISLRFTKSDTDLRQ